MASIGENIRVLRLARGWTQEQLAEKLHMTRQAVGHYESGRTTPDVETCRRLATLFEVDLEVLLEGEGEPAKLPRWLFSLTLGAAGLFPLVRSVLMVVNQHLYPVAQGQISSGSEEWEIAQKHFARRRRRGDGGICGFSGGAGGTGAVGDPAAAGRAVAPKAGAVGSCGRGHRCHHLSPLPFRSRVRRRELPDPRIPHHRTLRHRAGGGVGHPQGAEKMKKEPFPTGNGSFLLLICSL